MRGNCLFFFSKCSVQPFYLPLPLISHKMNDVINMPLKSKFCVCKLCLRMIICECNLSKAQVSGQGDDHAGAGLRVWGRPLTTLPGPANYANVQITPNYSPDCRWGVPPSPLPPSPPRPPWHPRLPLEDIVNWSKVRSPWDIEVCVLHCHACDMWLLARLLNLPCMQHLLQAALFLLRNHE
jgi:hypothetical protein